jgi:hypothetical protein
MLRGQDIGKARWDDSCDADLFLSSANGYAIKKLACIFVKGHAGHSLDVPTKPRIVSGH